MTQPIKELTETAAWPWPDSLDATIAAPEYHRLLLDNARVRVLESWIPPGVVVPLHTHRWPAVYYTIAAGDFVRRDSAGKVLFDTRGAPRFLTSSGSTWVESLPPHSVENVSSSEIRIISVELKDS